jgi:hypothetical protein
MFRGLTVAKANKSTSMSIKEKRATCFALPAAGLLLVTTTEKEWAG